MTEAETDERIEELQRAAEDVWIGEFLSGPRRTRLAELPPQVGDPAPEVELPDASGRMRRLSEFWSEQPVHLVFVRHFGCGCLADRWKELQPAQEKVAAAGALTVVVCQAEPERAVRIAEQRGYTFPLLCDPALAAYERYGLPEGEVATILHDTPWRPNDRKTAEEWTASRRGTERALMDHTWQLPGEFVIAKGGAIVLTHRAQICEDFPPTPVLLGAIAAAQAGDR